ncbi:hypothetical protein Poly41_60400 [Novipirellula artificiosorum]|uniref:Uncharacterized protein n=1 Tax=Novipirellula artificiosorum TaxID=2528016 RepID=A0A5C6D6V5_9BACT|nr:hypothetical protein Poly41_60400 [Novipirellula artificiosorum]
MTNPRAIRSLIDRDAAPYRGNGRKVLAHVTGVAMPHAPKEQLDRVQANLLDNRQVRLAVLIGIQLP